MARDKRIRTNDEGASSFRRRARTPDPNEGYPMRVDGIEFLDAQSHQNYLRMSQRVMLSTQFYSPETIEALGFNELTTMFSNVGLQDFITMHLYTYHQLALEFLSTLNKTMALTFRLGNTDRELTYGDLASIFRFRDNGNREVIPPHTLVAFWQQISSDQAPFNPQSAKASSIRNPQIRYAHAFLAHTIFARGDVGGVRNDELSILYSMLHPNTLCVKLGIKLAQQFRSVASNASTIRIGGLVTPIINHFQINMSRIAPIPATFLDISYLKQKGFLKKGVNRHVYLGKSFSVNLPCPQNTISNPKGVEFKMFEDDDEDETDKDDESEEVERGRGRNIEERASSSSHPPHITYEDFMNLRGNIAAVQQGMGHIGRRMDQNDAAISGLTQTVNSMAANQQEMYQIMQQMRDWQLAHFSPPGPQGP